MNPASVYPIQTVSLRTELSEHVIRAWESRYGAVLPARRGGRRLYSEADIQRLALLKRCVAAGHRIGTIASLDTGALRSLAAPPLAAATDEIPGALGTLMTEALSKIAALDAQALESVLQRAATTVGSDSVIELFLFPLLAEVGHRWSQGVVGIAEEHLLSTVARGYLSGRLMSRAPEPDAPVAVIAAPAGELHDVGCLAAAVWVQEAGRRVITLGANTPPDSVAEAVTASGASLVIVVVAVEELLTDLIMQLDSLHAQTQPDVHHILAGRLSDRLAARAREHGFHPIRSPAELQAVMR